MGGGAPGGGGGSTGGGRRPSGSLPSLEAMAPLPEAPDVYPPDTTVYTIRMTFELEIIDPKAMPQASADTPKGGRS